MQGSRSMAAAPESSNSSACTAGRRRSSCSRARASSPGASGCAKPRGGAWAGPVGAW